MQRLLFLSKAHSILRSDEVLRALAGAPRVLEMGTGLPPAYIVPCIMGTWRGHPAHYTG